MKKVRLKFLSITASAAIIAVLVFAPVAAFAEQSKPLDDPWASRTANRIGFITESDRRTPSVADNGSADLIDRLCAQATRNSGTNCPSGLKGGSGFPRLTDDISAGLPHLRLNIILREMQNVVVSGTGVDSLGIFEEPWSRFKIESSAADDSIPAPADPAYGLPVPAPGDTWSDISHANALYQGIIENGCVGTPATFDLTLDSSVFRISTGDVFGEVHLVDEVEGYGYYDFEYTIRAMDEEGNVSDFVFSGDANSFCTSQSALSATLVGDTVTAFDSSKLQSLERSDIISKEDIDRSPDGYRLSVPGVGDVYLKALRAPVDGKRCYIHKPSLIDALAADPPVLKEPKWLNFTIYDAPGGTLCIPPFGGSCFAMVQK